MGHAIRGAAELVAKVPAKIYIHKAELPFVHRLTGLSQSDLVPVEGGDEVAVGNLKVKFVHTPGHTPGSQCFLVGNALVSGDTLFIGSCGRVDLPGSNPEDMYRSLTQVLGALPDETILYPGHNYADRPRSTLGDEKRTNMMMRFRTLQDFLSVMGGA
ncbi:MAG: MBL fold metallo-hydrolase [Deltaproteobacteria bacterium]|nr:MAG: MBL fold metallo-hydrolase [Deltaproteobacteria bacterium]